MTTVYDVPHTDLIQEVAKKLQSDNNIKTPEANLFNRTGLPKENPPESKNWWHVRCASILRKIYVNEGIGIERLRAEYGGSYNRGSKPSKARKAGGSIVRRAVQQLEKAGYVTRVKGKGRVLTGKGRSFMDNASKDVMKNVKDYYPGLDKY